MTNNLASKYSSKVDERFSTGALTNSIVNNDYGWDGVNTVNIYSIETSGLVDYSKTGSQRYGTPTELPDTIQTLTLSQDKAFTFTIDKGNEIQQNGSKSAGTALRRQLDEVVIPEVDMYRISKLIDGAKTKATGATTKTNAYEQFLTATEVLSDAKVPISGRIALVTPSYYKFLKLDDTFIKNSDLGQEVAFTGQVGKIDGIPVIVVPTSYMKDNVNFILTHPSALVAPLKLSEYKIHENPPGISGSLVEGRILHDAFVLKNKSAAIYVHQTSAPANSTEENH